MEKQTKIFLGISALLGIGYILSRNNKKKSFSVSLYDSCVNDGNDPEGCCAKQGGIFTPPKICVSPIVQGEQDTPPPVPTPTMPTPPIQPQIPTTPTPDPIPTLEIDNPQPQVSVPQSQFPVSETIEPQTTTTTIEVQPTMGMPSMGFPISAFGSTGGGNNEQALDKKIIDWIPYILAGMTIALSFVSESKNK